MSCCCRPSSANTPLQAGMIVSNEPGYYEDGQFGIRIENLLVGPMLTSKPPPSCTSAQQSARGAT